MRDESLTELQSLWPIVWKERATASSFATVVGIAVLVVVLAASTSISGDIPLHFPLLYLVPILTTATFYNYLAMVSCRKRSNASKRVAVPIRHPQRMVLLGWAPVAKVTYALTMASLPIMFLGFYYLLPIVSKSQDKNFGVFLSQVCLAMTVLSVVFILPIVALAGRHWRLGTALSKEGVHQYTWTGTVFFPWKAIGLIDIAPSRAAPVWRRFSPFTRLHFEGTWSRHPGESLWAALPSVRRSASWQSPGLLATNPVVLYMAIGFYLRNPDRRSELATDEGLRRVRELDFPEEIADLKRFGEIRNVTAS